MDNSQLSYSIIILIILITIVVRNRMDIVIEILLSFFLSMSISILLKRCEISCEVKSRITAVTTKKMLMSQNVSGNCIKKPHNFSMDNIHVNAHNIRRNKFD